jgi:hypothetical protein
MTPVPPDISTPWSDLLKNRVLLNQAKKVVGEVSGFEKLLQSPRLDDQNQVAAVESYANRTFNLVIDMTKALLIAKAPHDASTVKIMNADKVLAAAARQRIYSQTQWDVLDELRLGRNDLQHGSSWVPWRQVWRFIGLMEDSADKVLKSLQSGFSKAGIKLEMDFPPEFLTHDQGRSFSRRQMIREHGRSVIAEDQLAIQILEDHNRDRGDAKRAGPY